MVLVSILFAPAIFGNKILSPSDMIFYKDALWTSVRPDGLILAGNLLLDDPTLCFIPWRHFAIQSFKEGILPLWNPYINAGQPFIGNAQSSLFDVFNIIGLFFSLESSLVIIAVLRLLLAGLFTYLFAREIGIAKAGAVLSMLAYTFSTPIISWIGFPLSAVSIWLPVILFTTERFLVGGKYLYLYLTGLVFGLQFLAGHPENSFLLGLAWVGYWVFRTFQLRRIKLLSYKASLFNFILAALLGTLIGAIQIIPFLEALSDSAIVGSRKAFRPETFTGYIERTLLHWAEWPSIFTSLLPFYFGSPAHPSYWYPLSNFNEQNLYAGVFPFVLSLYAFFIALKSKASEKRTLIIFLCISGFICVGMALHGPLVSILNYLPIFEVTANGRLRYVYVFLIAILSGFGFDYLMSTKDNRTEIFTRFLTVTSILSIFILWTYYIIDYRKEELRPIFQTFLLQPIMYLPAIFTCGYLALIRFIKGTSIKAVLAVFILICTAVDLLYVNIRYNPMIDKEHFYPKPAAIEYIEKDKGVFRVAALGNTLIPNVGMIYGLSDIRGYEPVALKRYADAFWRTPGNYFAFKRTFLSSADSRMLDLYNVKYLFSEDTQHGKWELVFTDKGGIKVYENTNVLPRAFMVYQAELAKRSRDSLNRMFEDSFDFRNSVILENAPSKILEDDILSVQSNFGMAAPLVAISSYTPNEVRLDVTTETKGVLVLTDAYMEGWKAYISGNETTIYPANHVFRGIIVPEGRHEVVFIYKPISFYIGFWSTCVGLMVVFLGILLGIKLNMETAQ
jgi:hypothetical protein